MEKTRQLSTKMMASPSLNPNPSSDLVPDPISREEGELFSSDNDEKETHDVSDPASIRIAIPSANAEPIPQKAGILQENKDGRLNPRIFSSKSASQIQYKTVPPRIGASQDNNNLVISFSDDESTSDSDENMQDRHVKNKGRVGEITSYQKPTNLTTQFFQNSGKAPSKENPRISKQMTLSRKLAPSLPKHPGAGNRADSVVSTGQGSHSRNLIASRKLGNQERGYEFSVGSRNTKLQDLRQQIAIRENELKLKSAHLSKQSVSSRQFSALKVNRDIVGKHQLKSADAGEANGHTFKRLKVDGPSYAQSNPEEHLLPLKNITAPKELVLETTNKGKVDSVQKTSSTGLTQKRVVRWKSKDTEKVDIAARNLNNKQAGIEITSADQGMGMSVDPCPLSSEILPTHRVTPDALPNRSGGEGLAGSSLWSSLGTTATENRNLEIQSLSEMEESIDKDLEDAQEYRRRCEIEERNALKAYCKAQRDLIEANLRCTHLYRQRELYSSRLRSFIMDDSFLFGPSNGHGYLRAQMNSSNNTSENLNLAPSLSNHLQSEHDQFNVLGYASNTQGATYSSSLGHVNGHNIGSEPCSEPDASTSEPLPITGRTMVHGESSPSNGQCLSGDEDEEYFPFDGKPSKQNVQGQGDEGHNDSSHRIDGKISSESGNDPLLLEATLRSELFARLRMRSKQNSSVSLLNMEATAEHRSRSIIDSEKNQVSSGCVPIPESERTEHSSEEGTDREDRELLEASIHIKCRSHTEDYLEQHISHDDRDNNYQENCYKSSITSNLKSAFQHVKSNTNFGISESRKRFREYDSDIDPNTSADCANEEAETRVTNLAETCRDLFESMPSSYSCAAPIHSNWQLCMYDLRGKCNNDECPWQHIKDHSIKKTSQHKDSDATDIQAEFMSDGDRSAPAKRPKCQTPTYLVGLDILRENMHMYGSFVAPRVGKCWKKCFSICLAGSTFFRQLLSADDSILQNKDGRVELFGCSTNQSSYFRDRNCRMNELSESPIGDGQSLETALLLFNQEGDKLEGKKKALFVLSRALEVNPTSVVLWIVYLVLLYTKARPSDTDDLYSVSVKHNQASYELWLMYVNSRTKLEDRLAAYNEAISVLTNHSSTSSEENQTHTSSCILDLFLQMIECLCMSRNVERALQTIHSFLPTTKECSNTLLSSMLSCLTISDKCIFWVCCVYLVVYRKLPDAIVQQLECEKDLLLIQWPPGYLTDQDRCKAFELMDFAVCNLAKEEFLKNEAAHGFTLNHIRFSIAVNGVERSRDLLDQYRKKHPTCLDLVLISARLENLDFDDLSFHGFENALSQWPSGESGVQCIWNQYAESALQHGKIDFAKELMQRWFSSVWDHKNTVSSSNMDKVYGFLNLSLHKLLQQMNKDSHEAINQALTAATDPKTYRKCITEHALFLLQGENTKLSSTMLDLLNSYVSDLRAFSLSDPLSMKFIENVKKPRLQQLIRNNILCPISNNFVLVNSVLDSWFGSTLLPAKFEKVNDLVDFVECVMEISPSNYPLALSACKIIRREWGNTATTTSTTTTTTATTSLAFWASSVLVSSLSHALPIAAEFTWVESVNVLCKFLGIEMILEGFYSKALSVYPFSVDLWESYYRYVCRNSEGEDVCRSVVESAREKGIELGV